MLDHRQLAAHTSSPPYPRIASFGSAAALAEHIQQLGWTLPFDDNVRTAPDSPLGKPYTLQTGMGFRTIGNRFAVQPMEGWDGEVDGSPSELTRRRWLRFAESGAKLIWGCEAVAVLPEARANPNQLLLTSRTASKIERLRREMVEAHKRRFGSSADLYIGLQLTHSGRFCRPREKNRPEPRIAYNHPLLDARFDTRLQPISDEEVDSIIAAFANCARLAADIGFDFVDLKHCHGYLAHEFLSARRRAGIYGGAFSNRTRLLRQTIAAVRRAAPNLEIGVRLSAYDCIPFAADENGHGYSMHWPADTPYDCGFGVETQNPVEADLTETHRVLQLLQSLGIRLINVTAGSPYYSPHLQRPALFPPVDSYHAPEDPIAGAVKMLDAARELKQAWPEMIVVSSGWSYFQDYLPHFAQAAVRERWTDFVGLGRMMLSYPELPADTLETGRLDRKHICRTFSDCTNGPRTGLVSGCYPLDSFYKSRPEHAQLQIAKGAAKATIASNTNAD